LKNIICWRMVPQGRGLDLVKTVDSLPEGWNHDLILPAPMKIGDDWASENSFPVLKVPSVIVPSEYNYILNPQHPDFQDIQIGEVRPFEIDPRLIQ